MYKPEKPEHIVSPKIYLAVFVILICMTGLTAGVAFVDLTFKIGNSLVNFNPAVALAIAIFKATLVILFFMHIKYSPKLMKIVISVGFFWLMILLSMTMIDYGTRNLLTSPEQTSATGTVQKR